MDHDLGDKMYLVAMARYSPNCSLEIWDKELRDDFHWKYGETNWKYGKVQSQPFRIFRSPIWINLEIGERFGNRII